MYLTQLTTLLMVAAIVVQAQPSFKTYKIKNRRRQPFSVSQRVDWSWGLNSEDVRVLTTSITLRSSEFSRFNKVRSRSRSTKVSLKGDSLTIQLGRLAERFLLKGPGQKMVLDLRGRYSKEDPVVDENCKGYELALRSKGGKVPFYVGTSCHTTNDRKGFALTLPDDVELVSSTLVESKGKGEPWRYYELGKIDIASGTIGEFIFEYKKKRYEFTIASLSTSLDDIQKEDRITLMAGVGYAMLSISGDDIDVSDSKPALYLRVPHFPLISGFGLSAYFDVALPLSSGENAIRYTQFEIYASYEFALGDTFLLRPRAGYFVSSNTHDFTAISLNANQIGVGLSASLKFSEFYHLGINAIMAGFGSTVITSHYTFDISFLWKKPLATGYGAGARMQSFSTSSELNFTRDFKQMSFYALIAF